MDRAPRLKSLRVLPGERISASPRRTAQLAVTAEFADGSSRDVTRLASFDVNDPTLAEVSPSGQVHATRPSEVTVAVRYLGGRGVSRLTFLADRPGYAWTGPPVKNVVDTHVFAKLKTLRIDPAKPSIDPVFLRRAYLDAIGRLPTPAETRAFLADRDPAKRDRLIDELLDRPEFADFWALKWADLLRNEEKTMGSKGVWVFQRWLRDQIAAEVPLDQMVRQIVASRGSTYTNPPSSFHRTNRDPMTAAETVAQVFLGIRLQCARCHNHPFDDWTQDDYYGLAACFSNVSRKDLNNVRRDNLDKHEINGDEFVYLSGRPEMVQPRTRKVLAPTPLRGRPFPADDATSALDQLADWLTRDNRQFARNLANRTWFHLMGRGIVDPVDDFRESNPPSNPALLNALTRLPGAARHAAEAAGRADHEVSDLSARRRPQPDERRRHGELRAGVGSPASRRGAARRHQPGARRGRSVRGRPSSSAGHAIAGHRRRQRVLEGVRQARATAHLRMRANRIHDAGAGVSDDQRRPGQAQAGIDGQPDRQAARPQGHR